LKWFWCEIQSELSKEMSFLKKHFHGSLTRLALPQDGDQYCKAVVIRMHSLGNVKKKCPISGPSA
jgi:hypothetical protein